MHETPHLETSMHDQFPDGNWIWSTGRPIYPFEIIILNYDLIELFHLDRVCCDDDDDDVFVCFSHSLQSCFSFYFLLIFIFHVFFSELFRRKHFNKYEGCDVVVVDDSVVNVDDEYDSETNGWWRTAAQPAFLLSICQFMSTNSFWTKPL